MWVTETHTVSHRWTHIHMQLCKGLEQTWAACWTCIHVLMLEHILTKVWDQRMVTGAHKRAHKGAPVFM